MTDLVSVVIVAHNNWPDLARAAQSAIDQSWQPIEVIVIDNESSDETARMMPEFFGRSVRYLRQPNSFDGGGYNAGLKIASGDFIQFLDGDDFLASDKIEKQMQVFQAEPDTDIVYGDFYSFQQNTNPQGGEIHVNHQFEDVLATLIAAGNKGSGLLIHNTLFRRRALDKTGYWDESIIGVDLDYWIRAAWNGCRFRYCPGSLCFYQLRPGQMSANNTGMIISREKTWAKALEYVTTESYRVGLKQNLARLMFYRAIYDAGLSHTEAVARLSMARATDISAVSAIAWLAGRILLSVPGFRHLLASARLRRARNITARLFRLTQPRAAFQRL